MSEEVQAIRKATTISGSKVGSDLSFAINATCSGCHVAQTVSVPNRGDRVGRYEFVVHNPSSASDLQFELFSVSSGLAGADRRAHLTSIETTKAVCSGETTYDTFRTLLEHALFGAGDLYIDCHNITGSTSYASTSFVATVRLVELL